MTSSWTRVGPKSMTGVLLRERREDTRRHREEGWGRQRQRLDAAQSQGRGKERFSTLGVSVDLPTP